MKTLIVTLVLVGSILSQPCLGQRGKHLFILSGQSNMQHLNPEESFIPALEKEYGKKKIIVAKYAMGSQPIHRWYKKWKPLAGDEPKADPVLYDSLMKRVSGAIGKKKIATVTFIWMQGERDAREKWGDVYERSLIGLYQQLADDLKRSDMNFVIGRLSDFGLENAKFLHWTLIRDIQVKVAESNPRFGWINTDDLNDGYDRSGKAIQNDIHMSAKGYIIMGQRFAERAIQLIKSNDK